MIEINATYLVPIYKPYDSWQGSLDQKGIIGACTSYCSCSDCLPGYFTLTHIKCKVLDYSKNIVIVASDKYICSCGSFMSSWNYKLPISSSFILQHGIFSIYKEIFSSYEKLNE
jgi:hypothetical protein